MDPDWLGSPQHFVAAGLISAAAALLARRSRIGDLVAAGIGIGAALSAQAAWEIGEYLLRYANEPHASAYHDTIADTANSLAGAVAGALLVLVVARRGRSDAQN